MLDVLGNLSVCLCKLSFILDTFRTSQIDTMHRDCQRCLSEEPYDEGTLQTYCGSVETRHMTGCSTLGIH